MKQLLKYLFAFLLGAASALTVTSVFLPPSIIANRGLIGSESLWSMDDFETINRELRGIVGAKGPSMAVTPNTFGYAIHCFDGSLKARFGLVDFDEPIRLVHARMTELGGHENMDARPAVVRKKVGTQEFVHLGWFEDKEIARQIGAAMEEEDLISFSEGNLGIRSIWVRSNDEAVALDLLHGNSAWIDARIKGGTGFRAMQTNAQDE